MFDHDSLANDKKLGMFFCTFLYSNEVYMIQVIRPLKCIETYGFGDPPFFFYEVQPRYHAGSLRMNEKKQHGVF